MAIHLHNWRYLDKFSAPERQMQARQCTKCLRVKWKSTTPWWYS